MDTQTQETEKTLVGYAGHNLVLLTAKGKLFSMDKTRLNNIYTKEDYFGRSLSSYMDDELLEARVYDDIYHQSGRLDLTDSLIFDDNPFEGDNYKHYDWIKDLYDPASLSMVARHTSGAFGQAHRDTDNWAFYRTNGYSANFRELYKYTKESDSRINNITYTTNFREERWGSSDNYLKSKNVWTFSVGQALYIYISEIQTMYRLDLERDSELTEWLVGDNLGRFYTMKKNIFLTIAGYIVAKNSQPNFKLYDHFRIPKSRPGEYRDIYAVNKSLKDLFYLVSTDISASNESRISIKGLDSNILAFRPKHNIVDNATYHKDNKHILKSDIHAMFDNIDTEYYKLTGPRGDVLFGNNCTQQSYDVVNDYLDKMLINPETGGLYMGNPISPAMANGVMINPISYLVGSFSNSWNDKDQEIYVTVYADDITLSTNKDHAEGFTIKNLQSKFKRALEIQDMPNVYGRLQLNEKKTFYMNNQARRITGVRINHQDEVTIDRVKYRLLRSILYNKRKNDAWSLKDTQFDSVYQFKGNVEFWRYVDHTGKVQRLLNEYADEYKALCEE